MNRFLKSLIIFVVGIFAIRVVFGLLSGVLQLVVSLAVVAVIAVPILHLLGVFKSRTSQV